MLLSLHASKWYTQFEKAYDFHHQEIQKYIEKRSHPQQWEREAVKQPKNTLNREFALYEKNAFTEWIKTWMKVQIMEIHIITIFGNTH